MVRVREAAPDPIAYAELDRVFMRRIRAIRRMRGLSQESLASEVGMSAARLTNLELGRSGGGLRLTEALKMCDVLDIELAELIFPDPVSVVTA